MRRGEWNWWSSRAEEKGLSQLWEGRGPTRMRDTSYISMYIATYEIRKKLCTHVVTNVSHWIILFITNAPHSGGQICLKEGRGWGGEGVAQMANRRH